MQYKITKQFLKSKKEEKIFKILLNKKELFNLLIKEINEANDQQKMSTNVKAYMTGWNMNKKPGFKKLEKIIIKIVQKISEDHFRFKIQPIVVSIWGNIYRNEDYARKHNHWPSLFSGVLFLKAPKNSAKLFFPEIDLEIKPKRGLLIIFEGSLLHYVEPHYSSEERISVAFNIMQTPFKKKRSLLKTFYRILSSILYKIKKIFLFK